MLRFNRETKEAPHRWERQEGSYMKQCCHGWNCPYPAANLKDTMGIPSQRKGLSKCRNMSEAQLQR